MNDKQTEFEINNAIWTLFNPATGAFTRLLSEPMYLQEVEDFTEDVFHFDEHWCHFQQNLQKLAEGHGLKTVVADDSVRIEGPECVSVTFTISTYEVNPDSLEIDYSELEGMSREEVIEYLENQPSSIEPFQYVELELENSRIEEFFHYNVMVITDYPDDDMLNNLLDCFAKVPDTIAEVEKKLERRKAQIVEKHINKGIGTATIVEGLKAHGWSGEFVVEDGYSSFVLMIRLKFNNAARIGGTPEEIVNDLSNFLAFCKDYPRVDNPQAYFVRSCNVNQTNWSTL